MCFKNFYGNARNEWVSWLLFFVVKLLLLCLDNLIIQELQNLIIYYISCSCYYYELIGQERLL